MQSKSFHWLLRILLTCLILLVNSQSAMAIKHKFIAIDEGLKNLLYVNEYDSTQNWIVSVSNAYPSRDMQLIGNNRILIGNSLGYTEYNITTGAIMRQVTAYDSVSSVRRLPNGQTILFGVDLAGSKGVVMIVLDSNNVQIKKKVFPGTYARIARQTNKGTFLLCCNDTIKEADTNGTFIWEKYIKWAPYPTNKHMWKAERLDNGHIFFSGGYGAFLAEIDTAGNFIRTIGAAPQPSGVNPFFYAMWQGLSNGDIVVANWQNHGAGHGNDGIELLEFNSAGTIVWQWNKASIISSLQGVLILDSLNTSLLFDDRNGVMTPLNPGVQAINSFYNNSTCIGTKSANLTSPVEIYSISGRQINTKLRNIGMAVKRPLGIYIERRPDGSLKRKLDIE